MEGVKPYRGSTAAGRTIAPGPTIAWRGPWPAPSGAMARWRDGAMER